MVQASLGRLGAGGRLARDTLHSTAEDGQDRRVNRAQHDQTPGPRYSFCLCNSSLMPNSTPAASLADSISSFQKSALKLVRFFLLYSKSSVRADTYMLQLKDLEKQLAQADTDTRDARTERDNAIKQTRASQSEVEVQKQDVVRYKSSVRFIASASPPFSPPSPVPAHPSGTYSESPFNLYLPPSNIYDR